MGKFLKLNLPKIILFILLLFIFIIFQRISGKNEFFWVTKISSIFKISLISDFLPYVSSYKNSVDDTLRAIYMAIFTLNGVISAAISYIVSCLFVWIFNKFKSNFE